MKPKRTPLENLKHSWFVWIFPVIALAISGWFLYEYYRDEGPRIHIAFEDATGIKVEKTTVRFRGLEFGTVKEVSVAKDQKSVIVEVLLNADAQAFAVEGSRFSLVTPKVGFQGVSGLDALFEGAYIEVLPGPLDGAAKYDFKAQPSSSTDPLDDTSAYLLQTDNVESVKVGDSVTFRGLKIGSVGKLHFDKGARSVEVQINVENRYTYLVRTNTAFWRKAGVDAKLGLFHSEIKVNSLDTLMNGGIALATPQSPGPMAKALQKFALANGPPKDVAKWQPVLE